MYNTTPPIFNSHSLTQDHTLHALPRMKPEAFVPILQGTPSIILCYSSFELTEYFMTKRQHMREMEKAEVS